MIKRIILSSLFAFTKWTAICSLLVFFLVPVTAHAVTLNWNKNTETNLDSYKIYYGSETGHYTLGQIDVGLTKTPELPQYQFLPEIPCGEGEVLVFYVVTAFNTAGKESKPSNEASKLEAKRPCAPTLNEILAGIKSLMKTAQIETVHRPDNSFKSVIIFPE